jgi:3-oxoacyl-[acyl-carrier protein] reductase
MDLGLAGKKAIICASSKGLGRAAALALAREGVQVVINGRDLKTLEATQTEIREETGIDPICVAADVTTEQGRAALLAAMPDPDILVNNAGGPPAGNFRDWDEKMWMDALNANMITAIMLVRAVVDGMAARRFGRIVNITSRSVRQPLFHLGLSNGARAGLTGFIAGVARQVAKDNVIINNLLPGGVMTERVASRTRREALEGGISEEEVLKDRIAEIPVGRLGTTDEFGRTCAFLCSANVGFIVGENILFDGGSTHVTV